jgi:predicted nucleic acid-binding Zn ribbon protein
MTVRVKGKLPPGGCAFCGKMIRTQKLWCNINCQINWDKKLRKQHR